jgi:heme/copper-type cytochrome/quinol oxidase subunit 1
MNGDPINLRVKEEQIAFGDSQPPLLPSYEISPDLKKYSLLFIGAILINFLIAGSLAIGMRFIQADIPVSGQVDQASQNILFYALLTAHGQVMFFGVASMLTMFFGYYAVSKWGRKPISGMLWVKLSFWIMEGAVILIFLSSLFGFGAGWYNLMPLTFMAGRLMVWSAASALVFIIGDYLVGISLTIFCIVILVTILKGKLPTGTQKLERVYEEAKQKGYPKKDFEEYIDHTDIENLPASVRWVSLLGISSWFPKKLRMKTPAVPIILVATFITALVQISGNPGLFLQLTNGIQAIQNPSISANWLLTKDAWWFFAHPIVYFPLLIPLGYAYTLIPRYGGEPISYTKWNYRPWPFYFAFSILVFSHHMFMDLPNPVWLQMISQTASLGIVFPSGLTIITILMHIWRTHMSWNLTSRFIIAGIAGWAFGGFQGAETGMWGADIYQHNTMALPGHIHLMVLLGPVLMGFGLIYLVFEDLTKKRLNKTLGEIHFWLTIFGGFGFALLFTIIGMEGAIRREANMPLPFDWAMPLLLFFALCIGLVQFVFAFNLVHALKRKQTAREETESQITSPRLNDFNDNQLEKKEEKRIAELK